MTMEWRIYQTEAPISVVSVVQPQNFGISSGKKKWLTVFFQTSALQSSQFVLLLRQVALNLPAVEPHLQEFLDKVMNRTQGVDCHVSLLVAAQHRSRTWNDCLLTGNVRKFLCNSILFLDIKGPKQVSIDIKSFLPEVLMVFVFHDISLQERDLNLGRPLDIHFRAHVFND